MLDGFSRDVYLINDEQPGPLIEVEEGDDVEVFVQNDLPVENTIHWHGRHSMSHFKTPCSGFVLTPSL
jgi:FtsP/CotA-like multicopper oxidase with cupredoxin domain